jgi:hypothetical protein
LELPQGRLKLKDLNSIYSPEFMVRSRLDLLVERKWLAFTDGEYRCEKKALRLAKLSRTLEKFYGIKHSG